MIELWKKKEDFSVQIIFAIFPEQCIYYWTIMKETFLLLK
jgi:hypothetical protein